MEDARYQLFKEVLMITSIQLKNLEVQNHITLKMITTYFKICLLFRMEAQVIMQKMSKWITKMNQRKIKKKIKKKKFCHWLNKNV